MSFTQKQKRLAIVASVLFLFIVTNPSISSFKAFMGSNTYLGLKKSENFFVCSVYQEVEYRHFGKVEKPIGKYIGVLGNFFNVTDKTNVANKPWQPPSTDSLVSESDTTLNRNNYGK